MHEEPAPKPVHLNDYYGNNEVNSSAEIMQNTDTRAKTELACRAIRKKHSVRTNAKLDTDDNGEGRTE